MKGIKSRPRFLKKISDTSDKFYRLQSNCNEGMSQSCVDLGQMYFSGRDFVLMEDKIVSVSLFEKACQLGNSDGCGIAGKLYDFSMFMRNDHSKALKYLEKACKLGAQISCHAVGYYYEKGRVVEKNMETAAEYYLGGCAGGDPDSCGSLGLLMIKGLGGVPQNSNLAYKYLNGACQKTGIFNRYCEERDNIREDRERELRKQNQAAIEAGEITGPYEISRQWECKGINDTWGVYTPPYCSNGRYIPSRDGAAPRYLRNR